MDRTRQLITARLLLRPLQRTHAAALFAIMSDSATMRYWSSPPWTDVRQSEHFLDAAIAASDKPDQWLYGLERQSDGALIGTCTLFNQVVESRRAELGYLLARPCWGQGLMREALECLLTHGFAAIGLNRIEADIDPRNLRSAHLLDRLGFVREGLLRQRWIVAGEISDTAIYGLLASDWARKDGVTTP